MSNAGPPSPRRLNWRRWNNLLHRDVGYFCVALTVIYAISGVAVNHIHDWNPNYKLSVSSTTSSRSR